MLLKELFDKQEELDNIIRKNHVEANDKHSNVISKRFLAFIVELGEVLEDRITRSHRLEEYVDGLHFILSIGNELNAKANVVNCATLDYVYKDIKLGRNNDIPFDLKKVIVDFGILANKCRSFKFWSTKDMMMGASLNNEYTNLFYSYIEMAVSLGFWVSEIEQAYLAKYEVNIARQENGY